MDQTTQPQAGTSGTSNNNNNAEQMQIDGEANNNNRASSSESGRSGSGPSTSTAGLSITTSLSSLQLPTQESFGNTLQKFTSVMHTQLSHMPNSLVTMEDITKCNDLEALREKCQNLFRSQEFYKFKVEISEYQKNLEHSKFVKEQNERHTLALEGHKEEIFQQVLRVLEDEFSCSVCQDIFIDPYVIECGHTFCKFCITNWKKERRMCPVCRQYTGLTAGAKHVEIENLVNKLHILLPQRIQEQRNETIRDREEQARVAANPIRPARLIADPLNLNSELNSLRNIRDRMRQIFDSQNGDAIEMPSTDPPRPIISVLTRQSLEANSDDEDELPDIPYRLVTRPVNDPRLRSRPGAGTSGVMINDPRAWSYSRSLGQLGSPAASSLRTGLSALDRAATRTEESALLMDEVSQFVRSLRADTGQETTRDSVDWNSPSVILEDIGRTRRLRPSATAVPVVATNANTERARSVSPLLGTHRVSLNRVLVDNTRRNANANGRTHTSALRFPVSGGPISPGAEGDRIELTSSVAADQPPVNLLRRQRTMNDIEMEIGRRRIRRLREIDEAPRRNVYNFYPHEESNVDGNEQNSQSSSASAAQTEQSVAAHPRTERETRRCRHHRRHRTDRNRHRVNRQGESRRTNRSRSRSANNINQSHNTSSSEPATTPNSSSSRSEINNNNLTQPPRTLDRSNNTTSNQTATNSNRHANSDEAQAHEQGRCCNTTAQPGRNKRGAQTCLMVLDSVVAAVMSNSLQIPETMASGNETAAATQNLVHPIPIERTETIETTSAATSTTPAETIGSLPGRRPTRNPPSTSLFSDYIDSEYEGDNRSSSGRMDIPYAENEVEIEVSSVDEGDGVVDETGNILMGENWTIPGSSVDLSLVSATSTQTFEDEEDTQPDAAIRVGSPSFLETWEGNQGDEQYFPNDQDELPDI